MCIGTKYQVNEIKVTWVTAEILIFSYVYRNVWVVTPQSSLRQVKVQHLNLIKEK